MIPAHQAPRRSFQSWGDLGRFVLQFRTPDAPEMRQCQTKSFLGDLVCFETCNHDLRNSLKSPQIAPRPQQEQYHRSSAAVSQASFSFFFHSRVLLPSRVAARHNLPRRTAYASSRRPASRPHAQILSRVRKCPRRRCVARVSRAIRGASAPQQPSWSVDLVGHTLQCQLGPSVKAAPPACPLSVQALRVTSIQSAAERTSVGLRDPPRCGPQAWNRRTSHRAQMI
jgi:hypothetical protein